MRTRTTVTISELAATDPPHTRVTPLVTWVNRANRAFRFRCWSYPGDRRGAGWYCQIRVGDGGYTVDEVSGRNLGERVSAGN